MLYLDLHFSPVYILFMLLYPFTPLSVRGKFVVLFTKYTFI